MSLPVIGQLIAQFGLTSRLTEREQRRLLQNSMGRIPMRTEWIFAFGNSSTWPPVVQCATAYLMRAMEDVDLKAISFEEMSHLPVPLREGFKRAKLRGYVSYGDFGSFKPIHVGYLLRILPEKAKEVLVAFALSATYDRFNWYSRTWPETSSELSTRVAQMQNVEDRKIAILMAAKAFLRFLSNHSAISKGELVALPDLGWSELPLETIETVLSYGDTLWELAKESELLPDPLRALNQTSKIALQRFAQDDFRIALRQIRNYCTSLRMQTVHSN